MGAVLGLCAVCGAPGAMHTCTLCGSVVCPEHYDHRSGACARHGTGGAGPAPRRPHGVS